MTRSIYVRRNAIGQPSLWPLLRMLALLAAIYAKSVAASLHIHVNDQPSQLSGALPTGSSSEREADGAKPFLEQLCNNREWREYALQLHAEEQFSLACEQNKVSPKNPPAVRRGISSDDE